MWSDGALQKVLSWEKEDSISIRNFLEPIGIYFD
jgi:hypothetical protein